jgi:hypothetical protein
MELKITKAKVTSEEKLLVDFEEFYPEGQDKDETAKKFGGKVHQDLLTALEDLRIHFASKCEEGDYSDFMDNMDKLDIFKVTGISLSGDSEHEGVVITGQKRLSSNEVLILNTPYIKLNPEHANYPHINELDFAIKNVLSEVTKHVLDGKRAPSNQLGLFSEEETESKKKRKSRKLNVDKAEMSNAS